MPLLFRGGVALFLVVALAPWPYAYYQLLRWLVCPVAAFLTFRFASVGRHGHALTWGVIALVFNPLVPTHLERIAWNVVDVVVAVLLIAIGGVESSNAGGAPGLSGTSDDEPDFESS